MSNPLAILVLCLLQLPGVLLAQVSAGPEPFGIGRFEIQGRRPFAALVIRYPTGTLQVGGLVVDLQAAAKATHHAPVPSNVEDIIERYDDGVGERLRAIARDVGKLLDSRHRPSYVYDYYPTVRALVPFRPRVTLAAVANDPSARRTAEPPPSIAGIPERAPGDQRQNPYLLLVSPEAFIGNGEAIQIPRGRAEIELECAQVAVIGKTAQRVPPENAQQYVFGYANGNNVSDSQGEANPPDNNAGSLPANDGLVQESQHTFKPWGPFIVPKEFHDAFNARIQLRLNDEVMHVRSIRTVMNSVDDYLAFASNLHTLRVGDVIFMGAVGRVGVSRDPQVWMKPGDSVSCSLERLGTLTNPVIAQGKMGDVHRLQR